MRLGEKGHVGMEAIPTGAFALDSRSGSAAARGRIVEIFGPESSGKSTLDARGRRGAAQRRRCAYIDADTRWTRLRAAIGVNVDDLLISQPDTGEQALEIADMLIRSARSTCSSSTRSPRSCPAPRSRARWATRTSACRRGS